MRVKKENDHDKKMFAPKFINEFKEKYITVKKNADKTKQESTKRGKKAVRWTDNGKERFNNALDALGVMVKHIPGAESQIQKVVGRINDVRWERNAVDLKQFGAERAENAKAKRDAKQPTKNALKKFKESQNANNTKKTFIK